jgi:hypothetical protein
MSAHLTSLEILSAHNQWRQGADMPIHYSFTPRDLTAALDDAIAALRERPIARKAAVNMAGEIQRFRSAMANVTGFEK